MWQNFINELERTMHEIVGSFGRFLPRFLEMLVIVVVGWIIAFVLRGLVRSALKLTRFDKLSEHTGATPLLRGAALPSPTEILSRFVFWLAWLGFILVGISALGIVGLEEHISSFFSRAVLLSGVNADLPSPRLISWAVRTMIILFVVSMAFEELGIGSHTVIVAFALTFGSLMLGFALAFGLGGKDLAKKYLERRFGREQPPNEPAHEHEDELSPL